MSDFLIGTSAAVIGLYLGFRSAIALERRVMMPLEAWLWKKTGHVGDPPSHVPLMIRIDNWLKSKPGCTDRRAGQ